jgi:hypothetical protein
MHNKVTMQILTYSISKFDQQDVCDVCASTPDKQVYFPYLKLHETAFFFIK